jgi:hypothetical protein
MTQATKPAIAAQRAVRDNLAGRGRREAATTVDVSPGADWIGGFGKLVE